MRKKDLWVALGAVCAAAILSVTQFWGLSLETGAWGLSFKSEGQPPVGPAESKQLQQYDAAYIGDTTQKVIYLTFDSGYENGATEKILDVLKKHEVPAAFFLVGNYMEKNADLVRRMVDEGHTKRLFPRNCRIWKRCSRKSPARNCPNITARPREHIVWIT
jgi:peptidoglycan-N-acetylmuramic acid deacetylase